MAERYTVDRPYRTEIEIKQSRFIALLRPLSSLGEVKRWLAELEQTYRDAGHICYAYRLANPFREKAYDAGEPKGTAGRPILRQLQAGSLVDCGLAVVRYFGGIKLGTGGLTRAYGQAARSVIQMAKSVPLIRWSRLHLELDYAGYTRLQQYLFRFGGEIVSVHFGERVVVELKIPSDCFQSLKRELDLRAS